MSKIDIINAALTRVGSEPIASLEDGTAGAKIAEQNYEMIVLSALRSYPWRWASKVAKLNMLDQVTHGKPPEPWLFVYQLPNDLLRLRSLKLFGRPIAYATMKDKAFCDVDQNGEVLAAYTWRVLEAEWDELFAEAITQRLEGLFLRGVREAHQEAAARDSSAKDTLREARLADAQSQAPTDPRTSPLMRARRG